MTRRVSDGSGTVEKPGRAGTHGTAACRRKERGPDAAQGASRLPLVAIVGRPNVGKSTLFNRLVKQRKAIVRDTPGVTRDRISGKVDWGATSFTLLDTGGMDPVAPDGELTGKIRAQIEKAFDDADLLVFLVDGQVPVHPHDLEIARILRKTEKPIACAVNKIDAKKHESNLYPYYRLGLDPLHPVSAEHGLGLAELLDDIVLRLPRGGEEEQEDVNDPWIRVAVLGRPNVGKSTLVNTILGEERQLVDEVPGTTRDAVDTHIRRNGRDFLLIDTAGIRRKGKVRMAVEKFAVIKALQSLERCDVALLLLDAVEGLTDQDAHIGGYILEQGRGVVVLVNKWDLVRNRLRGSRAYLQGVLEGLPHLRFAPILPISARTGYNVDKALNAVGRVEAAFHEQVPTGALNRLLEEAVNMHPPPSVGARVRKFYYATQIKKRPPTFLFFTNSSKEVHFSYQRFLVGQIRSRFGFEGVPIRLIFRKKR